MTVWDYTKDYKPGALTPQTWASLELHGFVRLTAEALQCAYEQEPCTASAF